MRSRISLRSFSLLLGALLILLGLPEEMATKARGRTEACLWPVFSCAHSGVAAGRFAVGWFWNNGNDSHETALAEENQRLQNENQRLTVSVQKLKEWLQQERSLRKGLPSQPSDGAPLSLTPYFVPARVIMRSISSWNSCLWINVGETHNQALGVRVVAINSPVLVGSSLVGVIDYVGSKQSRVCLITDPRLVPAVRAARGTPQRRFLAEQVDVLLESLETNDDLGLATETSSLLRDQLRNFRASLEQEAPSWYLAKGELHGSECPLWRNHGLLLKGTGFNYDFDDEKGPARNLRTGKPENGNKKLSTLCLIQEGDLLVTSGLDGVFPEGLEIATVTKVHPLREGAYCFDLEALPTAGNLEELSLVFVLPPVAFDPKEASRCLSTIP